MDIRPDHVAIYVRWSTDDQGSGTTLEVQRDRCMHFVASQGWIFREDFLFVDDGQSGGSLDRPAMIRLREMVRTREVDCVVVYKIDRLSRNLVDAVSLVLREWRGHCHLKSATEPLDTMTDLGRAIFGILATFADFERSMIRERTSSGKERRIRDGAQAHGKPAYGYRLDPDHRGQWLEHPDEAAILRRMFALVAEGWSLNRVVRQLNAEGVPTRFGREWNTGTVAHSLRNRVYIGEVVYGRTSLVKPDAIDGDMRPSGLGKRRRPPKLEKIVNAEPKYKGPTRAIPALIDPDLFDRVQEFLTRHRLARRNSGSRAFGSPYLLVGISRCPCGSPLVHAGRGDHGHYVCGRVSSAHCKSSGYVPVRAANAIVETEFLRLFGITEERESRLTPALAAADSERKALQAARDTVEQELRHHAAEDERILRAARAGEIPFGHLGDLRASLRADRDRALARLAALDEQLGAQNLRARAIQNTLNGLSAIAQWQTLPVWHRRQLLQSVLSDRIVMARVGSEVSVEIPWVVG